MIGMVLVTHGALCQELVAALEHIVGPQEQVASLSIGPEDNMADRRDDLIKIIEAVDTGEGVAVITDLFGGSPSNLAISVIDRDGTEVLAGANLPMLVKLASVRSQMPLAEAVHEAQDAGRRYIKIASDFLSDS